MSTIEESIDVKVPVSTASEQWTEFELFPSDAEVTFLEPDEQSIRVIVQNGVRASHLERARRERLGIGERRITNELESFKVFIEQRAA